MPAEATPPETLTTIAELSAAAKPLMDYMRDKRHPECYVLVDAESARIVETVVRVVRHE